MQIVSQTSGTVNYSLTFETNRDLWLAAKAAIRRHADGWSHYAVQCYSQAGDFEELAALMAARGVRATRLATKRNKARLWRAEGDRAARISHELLRTLAGDKPESMLKWMGHIETKAPVPTEAAQLAFA